VRDQEALACPRSQPPRPNTASSCKGPHNTALPRRQAVMEAQ
jgi:hypothetical protein